MARKKKTAHGLTIPNRAGYYLEQRVARLERLIVRMADRIQPLVSWHYFNVTGKVGRLKLPRKFLKTAPKRVQALEVAVRRLERK